MKNKVTISENFQGINITMRVNEDFKFGDKCELVMVLTDVNNEQTEASVKMQSGWTMEDLKTIIFSSLEQVGVKVLSIDADFKTTSKNN